MPDRARWSFGGLLIQGGARMTCTPGVVPDNGVMVQPRNDTQPSAVIGDLVLEWGNTGTWAEVRRWVNATISNVDQQDGRFLDTAYTVKDRRWRWKFPFIHGSYNVHDEKGTRVASTEKNPRELATLLLVALGETGYDVSLLPTTVDLAPEVSWLYASAAVELQKLCELFGADPHLLKNNTIAIKLRGTGITPSSTNLEKPVTAGIALQSVPEKIRAFAGDTLFDSWLELEPVAPEIDGGVTDSNVKLLNDLSFMPVGGWGSTDAERFMGVRGGSDEYTKKLRAHCQKYIWRMFRIKGFAAPATKPPGYDVDLNPDTSAPWPDVTEMKLLLPLLNTRLLSGLDESGKFRRLPAELAGSFASHEHLGAQNLPRYSIWTYGFTIDVNNGYVFTNQPCFRKAPVIYAYSNSAARMAGTGYTVTQTDCAEVNLFRDLDTGLVWRATTTAPSFSAELAGLRPPILYLRTGYGVRKDLYGSRYHHAWTISSGVSNGSGIEALRKTEYQRQVIENYTSDYVDLSVTGAEYDNKATVETSLHAAADEYLFKYQPTLQPQTGRYVVPYDINTDGRVSQISWEAGAEQAFIQVVSVGGEHDRGQVTAYKKLQSEMDKKRQEQDLLKFTGQQTEQAISQQLLFFHKILPGM